jgi:hypothetical protein
LPIKACPAPTRFSASRITGLRSDFAKIPRALQSPTLRTRDLQENQAESDPVILRYKDDPRFAAFCGKVGLPVPGEASRKSA